jgi:hypothetical protein
LNENVNDFAKLNSQIVADLPDWKKQYDLRVSSYSSDESAPSTPLRAPAAEPPEENR